MDKKEKYYNYVLNDLVSKTEVDYDNESVNFPFPIHPITHTYPTPVHRSPSSRFLYHTSFPLTTNSYFFLSFSEHCKVVYGLTDEESEIIWGQFREIIKDKIEVLIGNG